MADNRKYYYLKLKENYFDEDAIILLEAMEDGILYSNILLKLYLKSLRHDGKLQVDDRIPYTAQMIARLTRHQVGTVERAIKVFMELGLVEPMENGVLYMSNIETMIGSSSTEAERKRKARQKLRLDEKKLPLLPQSGQMSGQMSAICPPYSGDKRPPERELEIEKEIEIDKEREGEKGHPAPAAYGSYGNVFLTEDELEALKAELPAKWDYYIERLSSYIASTGKKYQNHAATIRRWAEDDRQKTPGKREYSYKEGESL